MRSPLYQASLFSIGFFITGFIFISALFTLYLVVDRNNQTAESKFKNESSVKNSERMINSRIVHWVHDINSLSSAPIFKTSLLAPTFRTNIESWFYQFVSQQPDIDQLRLLDAAGHELVRINRVAEEVQIVAQNRFQDKHDRYYFNDAKSINNGVAISRMDLNVEQGQVEQPLKPVLRLSKPIYDEQNQLKWVLVINYYAQIILDEITELAVSDSQSLWLANENRFWMIAPKNAQAWGQQLEGRNTHLSEMFPELNKLLLEQDFFDGEWVENNFQLYVKTIQSLTDEALNSGKSVNRFSSSLLISSRPYPKPISGLLLEQDNTRNLFSGLVGISLLISILLGFMVFKRERLRAKVSFHEKLLHRIFENSPDAIFVCDASGQIISKNANFDRLNAHFSQLKIKEKAALLFKVYQRLEVFNTLLQESKQPPLNIEFSYQNTSYKFVRQSFFLQGGERQTLMVCMFSDLTQIKQGEMNLKSLEAQNASLMKAAPDAILLSDAQGNIRMVNEKAVALFGFSESALLAGNVEMLMEEEQRAEHEVLRARFMERPTHRLMTAEPGKIRARKANGESFPIEIGLSPVELNGQPFMISIIRDLTERQKLEEKLRRSQKMDAIGQLTGGIAHDFNNYLTTIIGNLDLAQRLLQVDLEKSSAKMEQSLQGALKAATLVKKLLGFSRSQANKVEPITLQDFFNSEVDLLKSACGSKVHLNFDLCEDPVRVLVDVIDFESAVINLIVNAKDAMQGHGEFKIALAVRHISEKDMSEENFLIDIPEGDYVVISFKDSGKGIDQADLERVFEPFFTTKPKGEGTGLGLAGVFGLMQRVNGSIQIHSQQHLGTLIELFFPKANLPEQAPETIEKDQIDELDNTDISSTVLSKTDSNSKPLILMVDDDKAILEATSEAIKSFGFNVLTAHSARQALDCLKENSVDLIVTDVMMPDLTGVDLFNRVRKTSGVPFIFISGYQDALRDMVEDNQIYTLVQKPFRIEQLIEKIILQLNVSE